MLNGFSISAMTSYPHFVETLKVFYLQNALFYSV